MTPQQLPIDHLTQAHISLDLETMGTSPGCAIVAIGAVRFDPYADGIADVFYRTIDLQSCLEAGLTIDPGTLQWWMGQEDAARSALFKDTGMLRTALSDFANWVSQHPGPSQVWGNGADFDNAILAQAYKVTGLRAPWAFWNSRCLRTIKYLAEGHPLELPRAGTHHNALDDAVYQARVCQLAHKALRTGGVYGTNS